MGYRTKNQKGGEGMNPVKKGKKGKKEEAVAPEKDAKSQASQETVKEESKEVVQMALDTIQEMRKALDGAEDALKGDGKLTERLKNARLAFIQAKRAGTVAWREVFKTARGRKS